MRLTPNFRLGEFLRSAQHPELEAKTFELKYDTVIYIVLLAVEMQKIRDRFGPIRITSGYRPPLLNTALGGADPSTHLEGRACDFEPIRGTSEGVWRQLVGADWRINYDRLAYYPSQGRFHIEVPASGQDPRHLIFVADPNWREVTVDEVLN